MERRMALTLAGTAAIVLTAASGAVAANLGILGASSSNGNVGTLDAQTVSQLATTSPPTSIDPVVVTVDQVVPVPVDEPGSSDPAPQAPTTQAPAPGTSNGTGGAPVVTAPPSSTVTTAPPTYHDDSHESEVEHEDHSSSSTSTTVDHSDD